MSMEQAKKALQDIELRTVQARIASSIGRQSQGKQVAFLLGELERIRLVAANALLGKEGV